MHTLKRANRQTTIADRPNTASKQYVQQNAKYNNAGTFSSLDH